MRATPCSATPGASCRRITRARRSRSSSTGSAAAKRRARSSTRAARWPRTTRSSGGTRQGMDEDDFLEQDRGMSQDQRAELGLGALVFVVVGLLLAMLAFVTYQAWPSFAHNGLSWFGAGGSVNQQIVNIFNSGDLKEAPVYLFHAWPLIWSTILITAGAVTIGFV